VFSTILIPLDGSQLAEQIVDEVQELEPAQYAEYTLLQVVHPFVSLGYHGATPMPDLDFDMTMQRQRAAHDYLESVARRMRLTGRRVQTRVVLEERTATTILQQAHEVQAELIALATHGRGGAARLLLGSVADKVLRGAECPVLVFRPTPTAHSVADSEYETTQQIAN
jgi:nucleotide-binding universal stress UspA family protein